MTWYPHFQWHPKHSRTFYLHAIFTKFKMNNRKSGTLTQMKKES